LSENPVKLCRTPRRLFQLLTQGNYSFPERFPSVREVWTTIGLIGPQADVCMSHSNMVFQLFYELAPFRLRGVRTHSEMAVAEEIIPLEMRPSDSRQSFDRVDDCEQPLMHLFRIVIKTIARSKVAKPLQIVISRAIASREMKHLVPPGSAYMSGVFAWAQ
jgi:hypothetical protein